MKWAFWFGKWTSADKKKDDVPPAKTSDAKVSEGKKKQRLGNCADEYLIQYSLKKALRKLVQKTKAALSRQG